MIKRIGLAGLAALFLLPAFAPANGLSLNGLGSRAQGMGGAFVSIADDFSAVFWNPAGAAGFKQTTFGFYAADVIPRATLRLGLGRIPEAPPFAAKTKDTHLLHFLAGYYKPLSPNVVVGVGIGMPGAQGMSWNASDFSGFSSGVAYDLSSRLYVFSCSPTIAVKLTEAVSVGAALNVNYGNFSLKRPGGISVLPSGLPVEQIPVDLGQYEEAMNGWGVGATFGVLVRPVESVSFGLNVRTPSTIKFDGAASLSNLTLYALPGSSGLGRKITWPLTVTGGASFRPVAPMLLSADVRWTQWSKLDRITTDFVDASWATLMAADGKDVRTLDWKDTIQVCFGAEYRVDPTTAVRAGYTYDPAPGPESRMDILLPTFSNHVVAIGLGKTFGGLDLDFGLEYLTGSRRMPAFLYQGFELDMTRSLRMPAVVPSVSAGYRF